MLCLEHPNRITTSLRINYTKRWVCSNELCAGGMPTARGCITVEILDTVIIVKLLHKPKINSKLQRCGTKAAIKL